MDDLKAEATDELSIREYTTVCLFGLLPGGWATNMMPLKNANASVCVVSLLVSLGSVMFSL